MTSQLSKPETESCLHGLTLTWFEATLELPNSTMRVPSLPPRRRVTVEEFEADMAAIRSAR